MTARATATDAGRFAAEVLSRLGYAVGAHNVAEVGEVLAHALRRTGSDSVRTYLDRMADAGFQREELRAIAREISVAETHFFRHPEQFDALVAIALPALVAARAGERRLSVLSAGCATGEEAYSLAAALAGRPELAGWEVRVLGIDVHPDLLDKARHGRYSAWSLRGLPADRRARLFRVEHGKHVLDPALRWPVTFEERNLLEDDPGFWRRGRFDVIFCRNVFIYFTPPAIRDVVARFSSALARDGFLFLGPSETLRDVSTDFHLLHARGAFFYQRRPAGGEPARPPPPPASPAAPVAPVVPRARLSGIPAAAPIPPPRPGLEDVLDLVRQERFDDALQALGTRSTAGDPGPDALLVEAVAHAGRGDLDRAEAACDRLLARDELRPGGHYLLAVCRERRGDLLGAAELDQTAIYLDPAFAMPRLHLGLVARRLGDRATAIRELGVARELLAREDAGRILLFGGGFGREALIRFCQAQLDLCREAG